MSTFLIRYPEFAKVEKERLDISLKDAESQMSRRVWGKLYEQGLHALMAHLLYASGAITPSGNGNGNPVQVATSETAGGLSIGYSAPDSGFSDNHTGLALTYYGQMYLRLQKLTARHFLTVR